MEEAGCHPDGDPEAKINLCCYYITILNSNSCIYASGKFITYLLKFFLKITDTRETCRKLLKNRFCVGHPILNRFSDTFRYIHIKIYQVYPCGMNSGKLFVEHKSEKHELQ